MYLINSKRNKHNGELQQTGPGTKDEGHSVPSLATKNFMKQAQRQAAAGRSLHKSHGVIQ